MFTNRESIWLRLSTALFWDSALHYWKKNRLLCIHIGSAENTLNIYHLNQRLKLKGKLKIKCYIEYSKKLRFERTEHMCRFYYLYDFTSVFVCVHVVTPRNLRDSLVPWPGTAPLVRVVEAPVALTTRLPGKLPVSSILASVCFLILKMRGLG